ncbi:hypothetical protein G3M48_007651 [Beauveria asiatica]|uniref:Uncharacterized protein n=1 Tax=Beauveria asiatica TaxID=1069075 RepID=A0AAW0S3M7_9HYPO
MAEWLWRSVQESASCPFDGFNSTDESLEGSSPSVVKDMALRPVWDFVYILVWLLRGAAGGGQTASGDCEARGSLFDSWVTGQCNIGRRKRGAAGLGFLWAVIRHGDSFSVHATALRALEP